MAKRQKNSNVVELKAVKAKRAKPGVFDPAAIPVMGFVHGAFKVSGNTLHHRWFTSIDGVGYAAIPIGENEVAGARKAGHLIAYVAADLCVVTTDMAMIQKEELAREGEAGIAKAMAFHAKYVGQSLQVYPESFAHEKGFAYGAYEDCYDATDCDKVDAAMVREYGAILKANALFAKAPAEVKAQFVEFDPGRTREQSVLHFAAAVFVHDAMAQAARDESIRRSNVYKVKHGLSKIDHTDPRYRAFTAPTWDTYVMHKRHASYARSLLKRATGAWMEADAASRAKAEAGA
ncbi:hypothetical protein [Paraburkholderia sp. A1RO-5L]|uniref:hypothetical protein n=1 Tax=Paraburkholderia sp. A1RO-5L TaxID=3028370 RepID=UPI003B761522